MKQIKRILFLIVPLVTLLSCGESSKTDSIEPKSDESPEGIRSVLQFGNPETGDLFETYYRTEIHENGSSENCFFYSLDSMVRRSGEWNYVDEDFERGHQSFCTSKSNDALYINFKADPPADKYDQHKYFLIDSIDFQLTTRDMRIYCYVKADDDPRWDETLYFSNELGYIYSHYPFFKKKYELISHSSIKDAELSQVIDSLTIRSGELKRTDVNFQ